MLIVRLFFSNIMEELNKKTCKDGEFCRLHNEDPTNQTYQL